MRPPTLVAHADWGSSPSKRWIALAGWRDGRYRAEAPRLVGPPEARSAAEKQTLLEAIHRAMREALKIPEWDKVLFLHQMFRGRSLDAKRRLYQALVKNLGGLGVPPADSKIILLEPPMENWGIRGGQMATEVDLGYEVKV